MALEGLTTEQIAEYARNVLPTIFSCPNKQRLKSLNRSRRSGEV